MKVANVQVNIHYKKINMFFMFPLIQSTSHNFSKICRIPSEKCLWWYHSLPFCRDKLCKSFVFFFSGENMCSQTSTSLLHREERQTCHIHLLQSQTYAPTWRDTFVGVGRKKLKSMHHRSKIYSSFFSHTGETTVRGNVPCTVVTPWFPKWDNVLPKKSKDKLGTVDQPLSSQ